MMFIMHISALFALSVLLGSAILIIWSLRNEGAGSSLGKTTGYVVFVLSIISLLCIGYYGLKYWAQGEFETPASVSMQMPSDMMQQMMPMMMEHMGKMGNMGMRKGENHSHPSQ